MVTMIRSDLDFILAQIKIAEADAEGRDLLAEGILPNSEVPWGLRRVDGSNNNLIPGQEGYGAANQPFPTATGTAPRPSLNEADDGMRFGPPNLVDGDPVTPGPQLVPAPGFEGGWYRATAPEASGSTEFPPSGWYEPTAPNAAGSIFVPAGYKIGVNFLAKNDYTTIRELDTDNDGIIDTVELLTANGSSGGIQPGDVVDADPRIISNLIVDQTANNPAALFKALQDAGLSNTAAFNALGGYATAVDAIKAARAAGDTAAEATAEASLRLMLKNADITLEEAPITGNRTTPDILKATLYIGNVAADEGLSAPFNGWMTLFGQFFDHGLDLVAKGGHGTVYIPLQPDDPLYDPAPNARTNFMALTRSTLNENGEAVNLVTPFVDQNQTYTSNASHQVFLREYETGSDGKTQATGRLLDGSAASGGGLATWADVKAHALTYLGIELNDQDIHHVPEVLVDPYGKFIPDPITGYAQLVRYVRDANGNILTDLQNNPIVEIVSGTPQNPVKTADGFVPTGVAFLDDIAHTANPGAGEVADDDAAVGLTGSNSGFYDNELLDAHYITGDGRGNENIGLTAVHHVFHAEHNRQVDLIQELLINEAKAALAEYAASPTPEFQAILTDKLDFLNEWLDEPINASDLADATVDSVDWNGERIFQAAKLPTEMQYQHLVFEEFARKVQPAVNVFNDYDGTLDPAILAEFAHTVYRFGHSMLTETVDRYDAEWNSLGTGGLPGEQIGLIEAFLNPIEFNASGTTAEEAAGVIAQGMTRQRGSEIDEFVTEALRNNLVGLPLDLAALNIARGRETGVPTLNEARADFYEGSGDTQVKPYASWFEFMQNLKNPASVINFIAAYGTHPTILAATTVDAKRDAATLLVLGGAGAPEDRIAFLNATGAWAQSPTDPLVNADLGGLNNVDFWIGGLAEKKLIFGGMLGSTFNFVFETQLEALQNGDRFYYLSRLANLNLTAQLENNKFSEMIHRNTTATHLPGDAFARPDFFLEVDQSKQFNDGLGSEDPTGAEIDIDPFLGAVLGDGNNGAVIRTEVTINSVTYQKLEFTGAEHVVLGGTDGNDYLVGGKGDDTLWGDKGDDRLEGGDGNDFIFGGDGNDIITDLFGVDEIRSNAGDDVVSAGRGIKLIITDTGNDWVWGGVDDDEVLAGQGNDFVNGGDGQDFIIGGEGNDWLESGTENGLMLGDNGDLVQGLPIKRSVDSRIVGHDVLLATGGNADFDAETGDDIMVGGLGTDRFFGQFGFDWATYKNDPFGLEADMNNRLFAPPSLPGSPGAILDRYAQTEALSGSSKGDILRGDDIADLAGGGAEAGAVVPGLDHALYDFNVDLIDGLDELLGSIDSDPASAVRFSSGNILLGGASSDIIEGRGGDDVIDGDSWLNVRIARVDANGDEVESHDTMAGYQARVLAGEIKVAELKIVREILDDNDAIDIAEFSGFRDEYAVEGLDDLVTGEDLFDDPEFDGFARDINKDGFITVTHLTRDGDGVVQVGTIGVDGTDNLKNVERLLFSNETIKIADHLNEIASGAPTITSDNEVFEVGSTLTATSTGINDTDGIGQIVFYWQVETAPGSGLFTNIQQIVADEFAPVTGPSYTLTAAEAGLAVRVLARFKDGKGVFETVVSAATDPIGGAPGGGAAGAPVVNEDIAVLGLNLGGTIVDGAALAPGTIGILEDTTTPFTFSLAQLATFATDPNNDALTASNVALRLRDGEAPGTLTNNGDGTFSFLPDPNFNGGVTFTFDVTDGVNVVPGEATLEVIPVNDSPVAPVVTFPDLPAGPAQTFTFSIAQLFGDTPTDANGRPIDIDGDRLTIDPATIQSPFGRIIENDDGTFSLSIPAGTPIQPVTINYTITDGLVDVLTSTSFQLRDFDPTGAAVLSDVGPTRTLALNVDTSTIADANGIVGPLSIQWQRAPDAGGTPGAWVNINNATTDTFTPATTHVGQFLRAVVTYTDGAGSVETLYATASRPTGNVITGVNVGPNANDNITGTAGDDIIRSNGGDDIVNAGAGDDEITGALGNDTINGGDGNDTINYSAGHGRDVVDGGVGGIDTFIVNGNAGNEIFRVYSNRDDADGDASNGIQSSAAAAGLVSNSEIVITRGTNNINHTIIAELSGIEEIIINTGTGNDTVQAIGNFEPTELHFNTITVKDGGGRDRVDATKLTSAHHIAFFTNGNDDILIGGRPQDEVIGTVTPSAARTSQIVSDIQLSNAADNSASGAPGLEGAGNKTVKEDKTEEKNEKTSTTSTPAPTGTTTPSTGTGTGTGTGTATSSFVVYLGTAVSDTAYGGDGADLLSGGDSDDNLFGFAGDDRLTGGDGDDHLDGGDGNDLLIGNAGADTLIGGKGDDEIRAGAGNDEIDAGDGNDRVFGNEGRDVIRTGLGNDTIVATYGDGNDVIDAGDELGDSDTLDLTAIEANVTVFLSANGTGSATSSESGADSIRGIENVIAGSGNDTLVASSDVNILTGGLGADVFVFSTVNSQAQPDVITDLNFAQGDRINLGPLFASLNLGVTAPTFDADFDAAGQVRVSVDANGDSLLEINTDTEADVDFAIKILGRTDLEQKDFA